MKSRWIPLAVGGCNVIGIALLALSVTAGGSAVRAAGEVAVDSVALEPLMKLADVFSQRIARIEAAVAAVREQLTAAKHVAQELCVADESGAQTCITKAQLDALLKGAMRTAQDAASEPAPPVQPAPPAAASCPEKCVAPDATAVAAPSEMPAAPPVVKEVTAKDAPATEATGTVAKEAGKEPAQSEPSTAAATEPPAPSSAVPAAGQPQAAAYEPAEAAEAVMLSPRAKPEETKPEETKPEEAKPEEMKPEVTAIVTAAEPTQDTTGLAAQEVAPGPKANPVAPEPRE
jgi:hypothetical protein